MDTNDHIGLQKKASKVSWKTPNSLVKKKSGFPVILCGLEATIQRQPRNIA
jgi:hypothetical protein